MFSSISLLLLTLLAGCATPVPADYYLSYAPVVLPHQDAMRKQHGNLGSKLDRVMKQLDRLERESRPSWYRNSSSANP